jgi:predicted adenylyl cyclase CyaB
MSREIELKAHVINWAQTLDLIRNNTNIKNEEFAEKLDVYYYNPLKDEAFRVRKEILKDKNNLVSKKTIFTSKEKLMDGVIEKNKEVEVELSCENFDSSLVFFESLGFKKSLEKSKIGYSFVYDGFEKDLHVELLEVNQLGWFLEIEFIIEENAEKQLIDKLVTHLYKILDLFEIPYSNIENKYYSQLLL